MRVDSIMSTEVATCHQTDTAEHAAKLMREHDCGAIPVLDAESHVAAMITDRDICMAALTQDKRLAEILVSDVMSPDAFVLSAADSVEDAASTMQERRVRRLPVVDDDREIVGILSIHDLARAAAYPPPSGDVTESLVARTLAAVCEPHSPQAASAAE